MLPEWKIDKRKPPKCQARGLTDALESGARVWQRGAAGTIKFRNGIDRLAKKEIGRAKTEADK